MVAKDEFPAEMAPPNKYHIALPKQRACPLYYCNHYFNTANFSCFFGGGLGCFLWDFFLFDFIFLFLFCLETLYLYKRSLKF